MHVFKKHKDAKLQSYLEIEIVAPSNKLQELYAYHSRHDNVSNFHQEVVNNMRQIVEAKKKLPPQFAKCTKTEQEDDPVVMYLVVKSDLGMGVGKIGAQIGHAVQMLVQSYNDTEWDTIYAEYINESDRRADELRIRTFGKWLDGSWTKVVLKASDKEFEKIKEEFDVGQIVVVQDAGRTEIPSGSETVIGIFPMLKSKAPKCIKRLQLLK
jgi:PTH2 family peptidyl-tRNA hydrolase